MSRLAFLATSIGLAGVGVASVAGLLGAWSTRADAFSHLRLHMALLGLALASGALWAGEGATGGVAIAAGLLIAAVNAVAMLAYERAPKAVTAGGLGLKIMTVNILYRVQNDDQILAEIAAEMPDVVLLQEMVHVRQSLMHRLRDAYPWQIHCADDAYSSRRPCDVAIVSRHPWQDAKAGVLGRAGAKMAVAHFGSEWSNLVVASIHLKWPLFSDQSAQLADVRDALHSHDGPTIVAGDLNAAAWSAAVRGFVRQSGLKSAGRFMPTWPRRTHAGGMRCALCVPQFQIDHVFVSNLVRVIRVRTGGDVGSDHLPLIAELELPRPVDNCSPAMNLVRNRE